MNKREIAKAIAKKAAENVVDSLQNWQRQMYTCTEGAIYNVTGLAEDVFNTWEDEYNSQEPTNELMQEIAFDLV